MQVNPSPPQTEPGRQALPSIKSQPDGSSASVHRYDATDRTNLSIDGVLLNGQPEQDFAAIQQQLQANQYAPPSAREQRYQAPKPVVGSEEWYKVRKDNHKEVERRRRETINKGIDELASVVPDCDKHKGQILSRAVEYIKKLKENEQHNLEKLTLEKLLAEQAISELSNNNKALKNELAQAWKEVEHWKKQAIEK